ncbi:MAG: peptide chain release factor 2 [Oscillospiraceae bacterium]|nr:peptide chain release factor 2 [Oscillospiraceae bacterium]MBQ4544290.1 peptide chain release factor 2 [Oscillospiraceae bacterium]MBQ6902269.1 peptide chain release factor 2 [Oscillospiraceae bacterium]
MLVLDEYKLRINALDAPIAELRTALDIDGISAELERLEKSTEAEDFWGDLENSQVVLKRISRIKEKLARFDKFNTDLSDIQTLFELAVEADDEDAAAEIGELLAALEEELATARIDTLLSGDYDSNNAIMSFQAGAGGTEAQDWAEMLYRMYTHWAERHGFSYKILDFLDGDEAGLKSASILIEGENAYGYLKSEMGVHRLVRISPFDSSGRRHTSFAALEVMPEITEDVEVEVRTEDLKVDTYRASGAGGQHVNKTESAIRITHIPTGIVVACQNERSQHQNREVAMRMLKSKLIEIKERENLEKIEDIKGEQKLIEWGSQIRSYVFMPYTLVKDHRTGFENGNIGAVMDGDIDGFINAYLTQMAANGKTGK